MAERTCLLNKRTSKGYRGFESHSLREKKTKCIALGFFIGINRSLLRIENNKKTKRFLQESSGFHASNECPKWDHRR